MKCLAEVLWPWRFHLKRIEADCEMRREQKGKKLTHQDVGNAFFVNFEVVYPALFGYGFALEEPGSLVVWVLI